MATVAEHKDCDILYMSSLLIPVMLWIHFTFVCSQFSGVEIEELLSPGFFSVTARKELQKKKNQRCNNNYCKNQHLQLCQQII